MKDAVQKFTLMKSAQNTPCGDVPQNKNFRLIFHLNRVNPVILVSATDLSRINYCLITSLLSSLQVPSLQEPSLPLREPS